MKKEEKEIYELFNQTKLLAPKNTVSNIVFFNGVRPCLLQENDLAAQSLNLYRIT